MRIALIAHDRKKEQMIQLVKKHCGTLARHCLYATGTTGQLIMQETDLPVTRMNSGPLGGDQQIGALVATDSLDLILFLRDPMTAQPHEPDVSALLRLCDVHNVPTATNLSGAEIMLKHLADCDENNKAY